MSHAEVGGIEAPGIEDEPFKRFVSEATRAVQSNADEQGCVQRIQPLLRELVAGWSIVDGRYELPQAGLPYGSYLLYMAEDESLCVVQDVFMPGQETGIHEHGNTWGVIAVVRGYERERRYAVDPIVNAVPRELDDSLHGAGETSTVSSAEGEFHSVECAGETASVSLHVYGADIGTARRRMWDAGKKRFVEFRSGYSNEHEGLPVYLPAKWQ